jgi:hypothetical protein
VEVLQAIAPLIGVVCLLQVTLVQAPIELFLRFLAGSVLASIGMLLLFAGIDFGILPMGRFVGGEIPRRGSLTLIIAVAFALGFATTVAEPDVLVLASQVEIASEGAMSVTRSSTSSPLGSRPSLASPWRASSPAGRCGTC